MKSEDDDAATKVVTLQQCLASSGSSGTTGWLAFILTFPGTSKQIVTRED